MADESKEPNVFGTAVDISIAVIVFVIAAGFFSLFSEQIRAIYATIIHWIFSGGLRNIYAVATFFFTVLDAILFAIVVLVAYRFATINERIPEEKPIVVHTVEPAEEIQEEWEHIRDLANSSNPSDWNMAIIRADALFDDALMHAGYEGTTLAERLKIVDTTKLKSIDRIWSAHRLRNVIAHDPLEQHSQESIISALKSYEEGLKELGYMK